MHKFFLVIFIFISMNLLFSQENHGNFIGTEDIGTNQEAASPEPAPGEPVPRKDDFWIGLNAGTAMYSVNGTSVGGGLELGYGSGVSFGLKAFYFMDIESFTDVLEVCFLLRFYLFGIQSNSGLFLQVNAGQALLFRRGIPSIPAQWGIVSAGLNAGWRFSLGRHFYLDPYIGGGYPYYMTAGLSAGVRF